MKEKDKVTALGSIKTKIVILIVLSVYATVALCLWTVIPLVQETQTTLIKNYMADIVSVAGKNIDREIQFVGPETVLTAGELKAAVGGIGVNGMETSYSYRACAGFQDREAYYSGHGSYFRAVRA